MVNSNSKREQSENLGSQASFLSAAFVTFPSKLSDTMTASEVIEREKVFTNGVRFNFVPTYSRATPTPEPMSHPYGEATKVTAPLNTTRATAIATAFQLVESTSCTSSSGKS